MAENRPAATASPETDHICLIVRIGGVRNRSGMKHSTTAFDVLPYATGCYCHFAHTSSPRPLSTLLAGWRRDIPEPYTAVIPCYCGTAAVRRESQRAGRCSLFG